MVSKAKLFSTKLGPKLDYLGGLGGGGKGGKGGGQTKKTLCGSVMDIFWNNMFYAIKCAQRHKI